MPISGTVPFTGLIAPTDATDTYAITDPIYGREGLRSVADHTERDAVTTDRKREGMLVYTQNDGKYWKLEADLTTWTEFTTSGAVDAIDVTYDNTNSGLSAVNVQDGMDEMVVLIAQANSPTGTWLISGGGVEWVSGFTFNVAPAQYYINGVLHNSPATQLTLSPADLTDDRFDIIAVDNTNTAVVLEGDPSSTPALPDVDPQTTLALNIIRVDAAATEPDIATALIYDENVGTPTEWASSQSNASFTLGSTNNPNTGTKDVEGTSVANNHWFQFQAASSLDVTTYEYLTFYIRSKAAWGQKSLQIGFRTTGGAVGNTVSLLDGQFGFQSATTGSYQQITIPLTAFGIRAGTLIQVLRFTVKGGGANIGFYFDTCSAQGGLGPLGTAQGFTQTQADARYLLKSLNLSDVVSPSTSRVNLGLTDIATATVGTGLDLTAGVLTATGVGTPGGSDKQVQFNDSNSFGGDAGFTYDKTLNALTQGSSCLAPGSNSHAEGQKALAAGLQSHSEGGGSGVDDGTFSYGDSAHVEGNKGMATGHNCHAEGWRTVAGMYPINCTISGTTVTIIGSDQTAKFVSTDPDDILLLALTGGVDGKTYTFATLDNAAFGGGDTTLTLTGSVTDATSGQVCSRSLSQTAHAEGDGCVATGYGSHAEGLSTADGNYSHSEGDNSTATGLASHAEGFGCNASGEASHAEGESTAASGDMSHAEGDGGTASGEASHVEGASGSAEGDQSHVEGSACSASGVASHAEGSATSAEGDFSHAEGNACLASGDGSHAEGGSTIAQGINSSAGGLAANAFLDTGLSRSDGGFEGGAGQYTFVSVSGVSTDGTPVDLAISGGVGAPVVLAIQSDYTVAFTVHVCGRKIDGSEAAYFIRQGLINNNAGATALVGSVTTIGVDNNIPGWSVAITADNTNDALNIQVTGEATVNWVARVDFVEVWGAVP